MKRVQTETWVGVSEGSKLSCTMGSSDQARITVGEQDPEHEMVFDYVSFKDLVAQAVATLAAMDAKAAEEEAEEG